MQVGWVDQVQVDLIKDIKSRSNFQTVQENRSGLGQEVPNPFIVNSNPTQVTHPDP